MMTQQWTRENPPPRGTPGRFRWFMTPNPEFDDQPEED